MGKAHPLPRGAFAPHPSPLEPSPWLFLSNISRKRAHAGARHASAKSGRALADAWRITLYFNLESLHSFQPDFELYYSVYAAIAQSERESNHDNLAISIQHKIKDGTSKLYSRPCYGYKLDRNGEFVIVQEEAEVVKLVFNLYLDGLSILGIMRELEQRGITSPSGKTKWCRRSIDLMLENEKYRGNSVATAPTMSDAPKDLPRRRYMLSMHHEGIIPNEQFDDVQKERERRSTIEFDESGIHRKKTQ